MPVGEGTIGRIFSPLGETLDGMGPFKPDKTIPYFNQAPGIMDRQPMKDTLETGVIPLDQSVRQ